MNSQFGRGNCVSPHIAQPAIPAERFPADGIGRNLYRFLQPANRQLSQARPIDKDVDTHRLNFGTDFLSAVTLNHSTVPGNIDRHIAVLFLRGGPSPRCQVSAQMHASKICRRPLQYPAIQKFARMTRGMAMNESRRKLLQRGLMAAPLLPSLLSAPIGLRGNVDTRGAMVLVSGPHILHKIHLERNRLAQSAGCLSKARRGKACHFISTFTKMNLFTYLMAYLRSALETKPSRPDRAPSHTAPATCRIGGRTWVFTRPLAQYVRPVRP